MKLMNKVTVLVLTILVLTNCSHLALNQDKNACYIMYDAGSSGTRLYIYEQTDSQLIAHVGPKVQALADPVRLLHGKTPKDIDIVTNEVVAALDFIKTDGDLDHGKPKWLGFDWSQKCDVVSAKIYATAGMRIAEQDNIIDSVLLWQTLKSKLKARFTSDVIIETRTITGYEEGLFAWLSAQYNSRSNDFGVVEMGGASSQVTFPCADCDPNDDAVNTIHLADKALQIYSYSFLGLGQDEAFRSLAVPSVGSPPENCAYGVGVNHVDWTEAKCANDIKITSGMSDIEIRDPYNYEHEGGKGTSNILPQAQQNISKWLLTGAFNYTDETQINDCCVNKDSSCFQPATACFRPVYLNKYLKTLGISSELSSKENVSWTLGGVICETENCLADMTTELTCRWMANGCLAM